MKTFNRFFHGRKRGENYYIGELIFLLRSVVSFLPLFGSHTRTSGPLLPAFQNLFFAFLQHNKTDLTKNNVIVKPSLVKYNAVNFKYNCAYFITLDLMQ